MEFVPGETGREPGEQCRLEYDLQALVLKLHRNTQSSAYKHNKNEVIHKAKDIKSQHIRRQPTV